MRPVPGFKPAKMQIALMSYSMAKRHNSSVWHIMLRMHVYGSSPSVAFESQWRQNGKGLMSHKLSHYLTRYVAVLTIFPLCSADLT